MNARRWRWNAMLHLHGFIFTDGPPYKHVRCSHLVANDNRRAWGARS